MEGRRRSEKDKRYKEADKLWTIPRCLERYRAERDLPLFVELQHVGFWITDEEGQHISTLDPKCDRNSVMLDPKCLLYVYKLALRHLLITMQVVTIDEIDPANLVPHVMVRKSPTDAFSKHDYVQNRKFFIGEKDISCKKDFLLIELDEKKDLHMTMIYSKGVGERVDLLVAFRQVIKLLNGNPGLIEKYSNLPYFGMDAMQYWAETKDLYPNNVVPPEGWKPRKEEVIEYETTAAGSVVLFDGKFCQK